MTKNRKKICKGLISEFNSYPSDLLFGMLEMSLTVSRSHLINDENLKHISMLVGEEIQKELISRN